MTGAPDGIVLPKATGGADVSLLDARLSLREALHGIDGRRTRDHRRSRRNPPPRFSASAPTRARARGSPGLTWGAEDLAADTGALATRVDGDWTEPVRVVRSLALFGAAAAGVPAIDTVYTDFRDLEGLSANAPPPRATAFPESSPSIRIRSRSSTRPSRRSPRRSRAPKQIVAAFAEAGDAGVTSLDGKMLDRPHLTAARAAARRAAACASQLRRLRTAPPTPS